MGEPATPPSRDSMELLLGLINSDIEREGPMHSTMVRAGLLRDIVAFAVAMLPARTGSENPHG